MVSPAAFSRAARVRRYVQHVAKSFSLPGAWKYEVAAMLSQLGCVVLDPEIIEVMYSGGELSPEDQAQFLNHPLVAQELLKNIPRMESIAWMIAHQNQPLPGEWNLGNREMDEMWLGAQIIRAALAFDHLLREGRTRVDAAHFLIRKFSDFDKKMVEATMELEPEVAGQNTQTFPIAELAAGMVLEQEVRTSTGVLVAAKGQELTAPVLIKLKSFSNKRSIDEMVAVSPSKVA